MLSVSTSELDDDGRGSSELLDSRAPVSPPSESLVAAGGDDAGRSTDDVSVTTQQPNSVASAIQTTPRQWRR